MRKCRICRKREAVYLLQDLGDGPVLYLPGWHIRGFPAIPVCEECGEQAKRKTQSNREQREQAQH